jgi:hypothetical protein
MTNLLDIQILYQNIISLKMAKKKIKYTHIGNDCDIHEVHTILGQYFRLKM